MTPNDFLAVSYDETLAPTAVDATPQYATIQWNHTDPSGWLLPVDRVEEFDVQPPTGWERRVVTLGSNQVPCYYSASATVAILATTKTWFVKEDDKDRYLTKYEDGALSLIHI